MSTRTETISFHEAGHAVAGLCLLGRPMACRIFTDQPGIPGVSGGGLLETMPPPETFGEKPLADAYAGTSFQACFDEAVMTEAGHAAEALHTRNAWAPRRLSSGDRAMIQALTRQAFGTATPRTENLFSQLAYDRACQFLFDRWPGVVAVAERLIEKHYLTAGDVAECYAAGISKTP